MQNRSLLAILAVVPMLVGGALSQNALAAFNGMQCMDTTQGVDATLTDVVTTDAISCNGASTNVASTFLRVVVTDPSNSTVSDSGFNSYAGGNVTTNFTPNVLSGSPNGVWTVYYVFFNDDNQQTGRLTAEFNTSFFVLPESPVGVAALMGSSLAALGAFVVYRKRKPTVTE